MLHVTPFEGPGGQQADNRLGIGRGIEEHAWTPGLRNPGDQLTLVGKRQAVWPLRTSPVPVLFAGGMRWGSVLSEILQCAGSRTCGPMLKVPSIRQVLAQPGWTCFLPPRLVDMMGRVWATA